MKYSEEMKGKKAEIIATQEQLEYIGLDGIDTIYTGAQVTIVGEEMHSPLYGDFVLIDDGRGVHELWMLDIPLMWLRIIEE